MSARSTRFLAVAVVVALAVAVSAVSIAGQGQDRPSFTGQWTVDTPPAPAGGRGPRGGAPADLGSGWTTTFTITQDAAQLTVQYAFFTRGDMQPPTRVVFALDGSETANSVMMGRGTQTEKSRAAWDNNRLVIATTYTFANPATGAPETGKITRTLSLDPNGLLVVEVLRHGVLGGPDTTSRTAHRRAGSGGARP